jgi:hypothetical protein
VCDGFFELLKKSHFLRHKKQMTEHVIECESSDILKKKEDENPLLNPSRECKGRSYVEDEWVHYNYKTRNVQDQARNWAVLCLTILSILLCLVFYMTCKQCLFAILIFSACLCPFFHPMNAPLWLAIVLLIVSGWTFTTGALTVSWSGQTF